MAQFYVQQITAIAVVLLIGLWVLQSGLDNLKVPTVPFSGKPWHHDGQTLHRETLISSKYVRVESHEVRTSQGVVIKGWMWIDTPDHVNVLVEDERGNFLVFRQTKYGLPGETLAVCGGAVEEGETPYEAAQRELLEEMGRETKHWLFLGTFRVDSNRGMGYVSAFLAHRTRRVPKDVVIPPSDDLEQQTLVRLTRPQLQSHLLAGHFQEVCWSNTVSLGLLKTSRYAESVVNNKRQRDTDEANLQAVQLPQALPAAKHRNASQPVANKTVS